MPLKNTRLAKVSTRARVTLRAKMSICAKVKLVQNPLKSDPLPFITTVLRFRVGISTTVNFNNSYKSKLIIVFSLTLVFKTYLTEVGFKKSLQC